MARYRTSCGKSEQVDYASHLEITENAHPAIKRVLLNSSHYNARFANRFLSPSSRNGENCPPLKFFTIGYIRRGGNAISNHLF